MNTQDTYSEQADRWAEFVGTLDDKDKAHLLLQIVGPFIDEGSVGQQVKQNRDFKLFALELAETLGSDHCQTLYRLAVLATKLA